MVPGAIVHDAKSLSQLQRSMNKTNSQHSNSNISFLSRQAMGNAYQYPMLGVVQPIPTGLCSMTSLTRPFMMPQMQRAGSAKHIKLNNVQSARR